MLHHGTVGAPLYPRTLSLRTTHTTLGPPPGRLHNAPGGRGREPRRRLEALKRGPDHSPVPLSPPTATSPAPLTPGLHGDRSEMEDQHLAALLDGSAQGAALLSRYPLPHRSQPSSPPLLGPGCAPHYRAPPAHRATGLGRCLCAPHRADAGKRRDLPSVPCGGAPGAPPPPALYH